MGNRLTKYRHKRLRNDFEYDVPGRQKGEKRVILEDGKINIDYKCFKKSRKEKDILKAAKLQWKYDQALKR